MKIQTIQHRDTSNGILQMVDNNLAPKNSVAFGLNMVFDRKIGRATIRGGSALIGAQIVNSQSILGIHQFYSSSNGTRHLIAVVNGASVSQIYRLETGTWTSTGESGRMTKDKKVRFTTYLDTVMAQDGVDSISSEDGTTWDVTGGDLDIGNCPNGITSIEWRDRIYVVGVSPYLDRLYYSSIPTSGSISWSVGNGYIDIEPYQGQGDITGLWKVPGYLLIFKDRALKRWNGSSTFPDDLCNIGCPSQESIVAGKTTAFFFSASFKKSIGIYETNGASTVKISRPIQEIIEAIDASNYTEVAGYGDGEVALWSVGDITYDGISYSNVVIYYHLTTRTWSVLSYPTKFLNFTSYIDSTTLKMIAGNNDGEVIELFTGNTDSITGSLLKPIEYALQYQPTDLGNRSVTKNISKISTLTKNGTEGKVFARIDEKEGFREIGAINDDYENVINTSLTGHTFEIRIAGLTSTVTEIIGYDLVLPNINSTIKQ